MNTTVVDDSEMSTISSTVNTDLNNKAATNSIIRRSRAFIMTVVFVSLVVGFSLLFYIHPTTLVDTPTATTMIFRSDEPSSSSSSSSNRMTLLSETDLVYPNIYPNITHNLLDFTVAGFAKCGTTFLMRDVFGSSKSIYMGYQNTRGQYKEMHQLENVGQLPEFISYFTPPMFDSSLQKNKHIKRGFKAPNTLMFDESLLHLSLYFPKVRFVVSVRHPILWFQSNYNYKMRLDKYAQDFNITPFNRVGECKGGISNTNNKDKSSCRTRQSCVSHKPGFGCTDLANFHIHLSRLGWTPRTSVQEKSLLQNRVDESSSSVFNFTQSQMFIMELGQLDPRKNSTNTVQLVQDLESFLGLESGSLPPIQPPKTTGTSKHVQKAQGQELVLSRMIQICNTEFVDIRKLLLQQGKDASDWIKEFFLNSPHVVVSNRQYFIELLETWKSDPCDHVVVQEGNGVGDKHS